MSGSIKYLVFGLAVLALLGLSEYRGWSMLRTNEVRQVGPTVRDNPGAYRPHYYGSGRYVGGK
ncbi:MAG TPA: hypothetical protein VHG28_22850 [Longimicrobiaceae bacterium]|nr:hypothetical protein [Longimicrobiaceae bacterium]